LRLMIGQTSFWSWIQTPAEQKTPAPVIAPPIVGPPAAEPAPEATPEPPAPAPQAPPDPHSGVPGGPPIYASPGLPCPASGGTAAATSSISTSSGHVGDPVVLTINNTGNICLYDDLNSWFES